MEKLKEAILNDWIPVAELTTILGITRQSLHLKIADLEKEKRGKSIYIKTDDFLNKLCPPKLRLELAASSGNSSSEIKPIKVRTDQLTDKQKHFAFMKDSLLRAYENSFSGLGYSEIGKAKDEFVDAYNSGELYPNIYKAIGARSRKSLDRWLKEWVENGRNAYILAPNFNYTDELDSSLSEAEQKLFLSILLKPQQIKVSKAYQLTKYILETRYNVKSIASESSYRRFAKEYEKKHLEMWVLLRDGEKKLREKVLPYIERDTQLLEVGDVFVADGKVTTFDVINPFTGKRGKATFVAYLDWKSMDIAGYELMITENTQSVASALRNSIIRLGKKPKIAYQDNGKAFKNKFFNNAEDFEEIGWTGMFAAIDIIPVYAMPYNAKAKIVELRWKEMVEGFEKLIPSFTGTSPVNKPAYMMRNEIFHKKYHEALTGNYVPTLTEAKMLIEIWLDFYRSQPCPHVKGKSIGEAFNDAKGNGVDIEELDDLMMKWGDKPMLVKTNGVSLLDARYYSEELTPLVGQRVWVKYSLFDISYVVVCDERGKKICKAERREKVHPMAHYLGTPKDVNELQTQSRHKAKLEKNIKKQTKELMKHHEKINYLQLPETTAEEVGDSEIITHLAEESESKIYTWAYEKEEAENKKAAQG